MYATSCTVSLSLCALHKEKFYTTHQFPLVLQPQLYCFVLHSLLSRVSFQLQQAVFSVRYLPGTKQTYKFSNWLLRIVYHSAKKELNVPAAWAEKLLIHVYTKKTNGIIISWQFDPTVTKNVTEIWSKR